MLKTTKKQGFLFLLIKLILFLGVLYFLYVQVTAFPYQKSDFHVSNWLLLLLGTILVFPNIYMVFLIWKDSLISAGVQFEKRQLNHSFFAGLVTGLLTPNMVGNFIGRVYYFEPKDRTVLIGLTLYGNHAHFVTSLIFGVFSFAMVDRAIWGEYLDVLFWPLLLIVLLGVMIYFFPQLFISKKWKKWKLNELREVLVNNRNLASRFLLYTGVRFVVFSTQFYLILIALGVEPSLELYMNIWFVYFITLSAPSLFLGKLGVKESISIFVLSTLGISPVVILFASLYIWLLNTLAPAMLGLFITKDRKVA